MEKHIFEETQAFISPEERSRLVRLCSTLVGNSEVAEDLAQETLLEAWRHQQTLRDSARYSQWLTGIARNICLRWLRKHGRELSHLASVAAQADPQSAELEDTLVDDFDIEVELERKELIELLDRSLALLPAETRTVLIQHYIEESPLAEVATQLGTNPHAVAMRLQRGKLALRRLLTNSTEHNLLPVPLSLPTTHWEETPLWCDLCGQHRLLGMRNQQEGNLFLKCPHCSPAANQATSINHHLATLKEVKGYKPLLSRLRAWCHDYYRTGLAQGSIACIQCGHLQEVVIETVAALPDWAFSGKEALRCAWSGSERVVSTLCSTCRSSCTTSLEGLVHCLPESRQFLQTHGRIHTLPQQQSEFEGSKALITRIESATGSEMLVVVSAYDTFKVLQVYRGSL